MAFQRRWIPFMVFTTAVAVFLGGIVFWSSRHKDAFIASPHPADAASALAELRDGNRRFVNSNRLLSTDTRHDAEHRHRTAKEQHPFVAILCCSDSRVCPEFIFDQRQGSIFEIRNAGNVVDEDVLASFEYAVEHLHVPLLLVMGHKGCGAVKAVCEAGNKPLHDHLRELQKHMTDVRRLVAEAHGKQPPGLMDVLCQENAKHQALALLRDSPFLQHAVQKRQARIVYAFYDMESGVVDFFDFR